MSRQTKQADLRKRMVEARSKLLSSQSPQQPDDGRVEIQLAGQKRPAPTAPTGGILRKSKYNSVKAGDLPHHKESGNEANTSASGAPKAALLEHEADERRKKKKKKEKKRKKRVADQHEQESTHQQRQNGEEDGVDDMEAAFSEFNALLEADETNAALAMPPQHSVPSVDEAKAKKKKKKKKRKEKDVYGDNDATNNLAQASYEARIARLTLLTKSKKKEQRAACDELDFYDPGLAFQQDEEPQDVAQDSPLSDRGEGSKQTNNSHLAKALRERIEEARKLTRSTTTKEGEEEESSDVQDGSWF